MEVLTSVLSPSPGTRTPNTTWQLIHPTHKRKKKTISYQMLCVKLAKDHKSAISLPWSFQPTSDPFVNSWFITGSYFLCQIYKLYCARFDRISTLYTTQWDSKFIVYELLPWKITSMQSGFHLESMGNKFIQFFFWMMIFMRSWVAI